MKGQKYDEAKAGVDVENFGGIPYQEEEYYEYRNWLEKYLLDNPNDAGLSEEELMGKFRGTESLSKRKSASQPNSPEKQPFEGAVPGDPESLT